MHDGKGGSKNATVNRRQFWHGLTARQPIKPIALWSSSVIAQKLNYIPMNPVESGLVSEPEYWKYSNAID
ncbi:MAG: hypothetical protein RIA69_20425 [Cyclobacteriaceae bacterium]